MSKDAVSRQQSRNAPTPHHIHYPFWFGGSASCFAATVTHPLDLVKVRLQTRSANAPNGMFKMVAHIVKTDSFLGLYRGLSASLLRQLTYSTTRFGVYSELKETFATARQQPALPSLIAMASTSGFLGGIAGNPADVINVRMQNDRSLPEAQRRNYKHAIDGFVRIIKDEGWQALFRGVGANSARAVLMTASQLASYDTIKRALRESLGMQDGFATHFSASFLAGFVATTICSPVDVIKTRVMSASQKEGLVALLTRIYQAEGISWAFRGWVPSFIRLGPHTIATFLFLEQHKKIYRYLKNEIDEDE